VLRRRARLVDALAPRPLARAAGAREILDGPVPLADLRETLAVIARLNAVFGGRRLTPIHVRALLGGVPAGRRVTVLDVGSGGGDIPRALVRWARRVRRPIRVLALDRDPAALALARDASAGYPEIAFLAGDALALPVGAAAVDVVISALTVHHLEPGPAVRALAEMGRAARRGVVVNDLERSRRGWALVWLATRVLARNRASRHDGPLSVLRAYTAAELGALCRQAGLEARVVRYPGLVRQCAVAVRR
jgi:SAM-dependent methyltransferase